MRKVITRAIITLSISILLLELITNVSYSSTMQDSYNDGKQYKNTIKIGDPTQHGDKVIFNKDADIANLSNMSDQDLIKLGAQTLHNSIEGQLLQQGELTKIDALKEHDLSPDNPLIKNSAKIEANPLQAIGGNNYTVNETITKIKTTKTCIEGVDFEVDIVRQLILESEAVDVLGNWQSRIMSITPADIPAPWTKQLTKEVYYNKNNWSRAMYTAVRDEDQQVQLYLRQMIATRLGVNNDLVGGHIVTGYKEAPTKFPLHFNTVPEISHLNYQYRDRVKQFKEKGEYWQVVNEILEQLVEENRCHEIKRICLESGNKLFFNQYNVTRPCWKQQISYQCYSEPQGACKYLKDQGCMLETSNCLKRNGNICLLWSRNYSCLSEKKDLSSSIAGSQIFCLSGDCHTPTIEQNTDISNIGYLAMLSEMKKDMQGEPIHVFKGEENSCRKNIMSFLNCCSSMRGWGKDLGLGSCKAAEKALALKREKELCHFVGTYCSERDPVFKKCLTKKSTYCCFNSKLARVFQQRGRSQLAISFGSPEYPNCRGLAVEELQRIDFSKFNMEELFADLLAEAKNKMGKSFPQQLNNQMPLMQKQKLNQANPNLSY